MIQYLILPLAPDPQLAWVIPAQAPRAQDPGPTDLSESLSRAEFQATKSKTKIKKSQIVTRREPQNKGRSGKLETEVRRSRMNARCQAGAGS